MSMLSIVPVLLWIYCAKIKRIETQIKDLKETELRRDNLQDDSYNQLKEQMATIGSSVKDVADAIKTLNDEMKNDIQALTRRVSAVEGAVGRLSAAEMGLASPSGIPDSNEATTRSS